LFLVAQSDGPFTWRDFLHNARRGERLDPGMEDDERLAKAQTDSVEI